VTLTASNVHIHDTTVTVECGTVRAAVELAERLICAQPVAYIRLEAMRRLIADPSQTTPAVGRAVAAEDMIGLHPMPQASARKQALEEAIKLCEMAALDAKLKEPDSTVAKLHQTGAQWQAEVLAETLREMLSK
jgi:hypothetical protein